jgi:hypothetical protein
MGAPQKFLSMNVIGTFALPVQPIMFPEQLAFPLPLEIATFDPIAPKQSPLQGYPPNLRLSSVKLNQMIPEYNGSEGNEHFIAAANPAWLICDKNQRVASVGFVEV